MTVDANAHAAVLPLLRFVLEVELVAQSPIHVGGVDTVDETPGDRDETKNVLTLARNASGAHYIPGTSLAGAVRSWYRRAIGSTHVAEVFGSSAQGSLLDFDDAEVAMPTTAPTERPSAGISRWTGAAADKVLFSRQLLPVGTTLHTRVIASAYSGSDASVVALRQLASALERGEIQLGAAATRGLGRLTATRLEIGMADLSNKTGLRQWFTGELADPGFDDTLEPASAPALAVKIVWKPRSAVLVALRQTSEGHSPALRLPGDEKPVELAVPLVEPSTATSWVPVIPGSSIKGALRSRAALIARTVRRSAKDDLGPATSLLDQLASEPTIVQLLFGSTEQRGVVTVDDCVGSVELTTEQALKMMADEEPSIDTGAVARLGAPSTHVAIDRWTGSVAGKRLFRILEPTNVEWQPIRLRVAWEAGTFGPDDSDRDDRRRAALCLLALVLAELTAGLLPLGSRTNRGLGQVVVQSVTIDGPGPQGTVTDPEQLLTLFRPAASDPFDWTDYLDESPDSEEPS